MGPSSAVHMWGPRYGEALCQLMWGLCGLDGQWICGALISMQGPPYGVALSRCVGPSEPRWTLDSQSVGPHNIVCGALRDLDILVQSIYGALIRMWGPRWPGWTMDLLGPQSICGALNKVYLLVNVWNPGGFDERSIYGALIKKWVPQYICRVLSRYLWRRS